MYGVLKRPNQYGWPFGDSEKAWEAMETPSVYNFPRDTFLK